MKKKLPEQQEKDKAEQKSKDKTEKVFKGLCMNCEHRFTCTLPRPETGVWYCEEYE